MTLSVDMRSEASPHIGLRQNGNCKSFNLHRHSTGGSPGKSMMQSYYSIDLLEDTVPVLAVVPYYRTI
jgi:hypothetical protein